MLSEQHPGRYDPGQLRTLQRRVRQWRVWSGPAREVMFNENLLAFGLPGRGKTHLACAIGHELILPGRRVFYGEE